MSATTWDPERRRWTTPSVDASGFVSGDTLTSDDPRVLDKEPEALLVRGDDGLFYLFPRAFGGGYRWTYAFGERRTAQDEFDALICRMRGRARNGGT